MRIMIDTNILISAALFPNGVAAKAYEKALSFSYQPVVCDYIVDELKQKFQEKFPDRLPELEAFLERALIYIKVLPTPDDATPLEPQLRDQKDQPILRAAIASHVDLLLTGDKDFLESGITSPQVVSVSDFLALSTG